jgi:hypothetical protein
MTNKMTFYQGKMENNFHVPMRGSMWYRYIKYQFEFVTPSNLGSFNTTVTGLQSTSTPMFVDTGNQMSWSFSSSDERVHVILIWCTYIKFGNVKLLDLYDSYQHEIKFYTYGYVCEPWQSHELIIFIMIWCMYIKFDNVK